MKVYINNVEDTTAYDITVNWLMNGMSSASFSIPNVHIDGDNTLRATWDGYIDVAEIKIEGESDHIVFMGYINRLQGDRVISVSCRSTRGKFKWYEIASASTAFKLYEGKVKTTPTDEDLLVEDSEGEAPTWDVDEFKDKYLILSDATLSTSSKQIEWDNAGTDIVGKSESHSFDDNIKNDYTEVESGASGDATYWEGEWDNNASDGWLDKKALMGLDMGGAAYSQIDKDNIIVRIHFKVAFHVKLTRSRYISYNGGRTKSLSFVMGDDDDIEGARVLKYWDFTYTEDDDGPVQVYEESVAAEWDTYIGSNWAKFLTKGANWYEGGFIGFKYLSNPDGTPGQSHFLIKWESVDVKFYYDSANFETLNEKIVSNTANQLTMTTNLNTLGVTEGDTVLIGEDLNIAFTKIKEATTGLPSGLPNILHPVFTQGVGADYLSVSGLKLLEILRELKALESYHTYDSGDNINLIKEDDIVNDGGTLTGFTPLDGWETTNQKYGTISVWWSGKTEGPNPVVVSTGNENPKNFPITRKDIITYAHALELAQDLAVKYVNDRPSIPISYDEWKLLIPGYRYDFTLNGESFNDQLCRRVTYSYIDGQYFIKAYLGGGSTPALERIGKAIGKLDKQITDLQSVQLTATFSTYVVPTAHKTTHESGGNDAFTSPLPAVSSPYYEVRNANDESTGYITAPTIGMVSDTFTITGPFSFYQKGIKYDYTGNETISLSGFSTYDTIFIYFNASRVLTASTTPWVFGSGFVFTAVVYKQAASYQVLKEQHHLMPHQVHEEIHNSIGPLYMGGFVVVATDSDLECTEGYYYDEDILHTITAADPKQVHVVYRSGANFIIDAASDLWTKQNAGQVRYDNAGVLTDVSNNDYVSYWLYMSPDNDNLPYVVVGQSYSNKELGAIADSPNDLVLPAFFIEFSLAYQFIVNGDGTLEDTIDRRRPPRGAAGAPVITSHNTLADRFIANTHKDENIATDYEEFTNILNDVANLNVEDALQLLDTYNATIVAFIASKGAVNGLAELDATGRIPAAQTRTSIWGEYMGNHDASGADPANGTENGQWYWISVAGNVDGTAYLIGDITIWDGSAWVKITTGLGAPDFNIVMGNGRVITSQDANLKFLFGRAAVGYDGVANDYATFAHRDMMNGTDYGFRQNMNGETYFNAKTSYSVHFRINNSDIGYINVDGLRLIANKSLSSVASHLNINSPTGFNINFKTNNVDNVFIDENGITLKRGDYLFDTPETRYYSIAPADFTAVNPDVQDINIDGGRVVANATGIELKAPVHLPHGAVIKEVKVFGSAAGETWTFRRVSRTYSTLVLASESIGVADTLTNTVDNEDYSYELETSTLDSGDAIYGAYIKYEITKPLP